MPDTVPAIELDRVSYAVGGARLVDDVSLAVRAGEVVGVLGPNGAGKSTLVKLVSGEIEPTAGHVRLDGVPLAKYRPAVLARRRAVVPQSSHLSFPFTALEVAMLGGSVPGFGRSADVTAAARRALRQVGLAALADRNFMDLSGGERQRVQIARAMCQLETARRRAGETPLLLLDEPTSSLDIGHQRLVLDAMRALAADGAAVLAILHDVNLAAAYCGRLVLMRNGAIVAMGHPADVVRDAPLTRAFGCRLDANATPADGTPFLLPVTSGCAGRHL